MVLATKAIMTTNIRNTQIQCFISMHLLLFENRTLQKYGRDSF